MDLLTFPGADRVLTAHRAALPQPDQLCGPFSALVALHAVLDADGIPPIGSLAAAAGTAIWPHDVEQWRPAGSPMDRTGWDGLPPAPSIEDSGTSAAGLVAGLETRIGGRVSVTAVPAAELATSSLRRLLTDLAQARFPVGIVANLRTGPIAPPGMSWDVGHFVVLCAIDLERNEVLLADTYAELGAAGMPPGCRTVSLASLVEALSAPPGRGLLLLIRPADQVSALALVADAGLATRGWQV